MFPEWSLCRSLHTGSHLESTSALPLQDCFVIKGTRWSRALYLDPSMGYKGQPCLPLSPPCKRHRSRKWGSVGTGYDTTSRVSALSFIHLGGLPFSLSAGSMGQKPQTPGSFPQFFVPHGLHGGRFQVVTRKVQKKTPSGLEV